MHNSRNYNNHAIAATARKHSPYCEATKNTTRIWIAQPADEDFYVKGLALRMLTTTILCIFYSAYGYWASAEQDNSGTPADEIDDKDP